MSSPKGFLGVSWGEETPEVARRLGVRCDRWTPWNGEASGFEHAWDTEHPVQVFGRPALVTLYRARGQDRLVGIALEFSPCDEQKDALAAAVEAEFKVDPGEGLPYRVYRDGAVVRLARDQGADTCTLTVAGPELGKPFADRVLAEGVRDFGAKLRPR